MVIMELLKSMTKKFLCVLNVQLLVSPTSTNTKRTNLSFTSNTKPFDYLFNTNIETNPFVNITSLVDSVVCLCFFNFKHVVFSHFSLTHCEDLAYQNYSPEWGKVKCLAKFKGRDLIGSALKAPLTPYEKIYVLPMFTVNTGKTTGIVTSVPSDSPDDYVAFRDIKQKENLRKTFGITDEMVLFILNSFLCFFVNFFLSLSLSLSFYLSFFLSIYLFLSFFLSLSLSLSLSFFLSFFLSLFLFLFLFLLLHRLILIFFCFEVETV
jgi:hypothetical protein